MPFNSSLWARLDVEIQRGIVECTIIVPVLCQPIKRLVGLKKSLGLEVLEQEVHFCTTSLLGRASEGNGRFPVACEKSITSLPTEGVGGGRGLLVPYGRPFGHQLISLQPIHPITPYQVAYNTVPPSLSLSYPASLSPLQQQ